MLIKTIEYIDYNGNPQKDTLYFNMNKAEIAAMQVKMDGKFIDHLKQLVTDGKIEALFNNFCDIILNSYGEKSQDGKRFYKTPEMRREFESSIAYSELLTELMTDTDKVKAFTKAILPPDFQNIDPEKSDTFPPGASAHAEGLPGSNREENLNAASVTSLPSNT